MWPVQNLQFGARGIINGTCTHKVHNVLVASALECTNLVNQYGMRPLMKYLKLLMVPVKVQTILDVIVNNFISRFYPIWSLFNND